MNKQSFFKKYKVKSFKADKCSSCQREFKALLRPYKQEQFDKTYFCMCEECFCGSTAEQRLKVFELVGINSEYYSTKCSVCKMHTQPFLQFERYWLPKAVCPDCFSLGLRDKDEKYFLIINKKQNIKVDQVEKIITKMSKKLEREEKYTKGDFSKECKEKGFYLFAVSTSKNDLESVSSLFLNDKLKSSVIDFDELKALMDNQLQQQEVKEKK